MTPMIDLLGVQAYLQLLVFHSLAQYVDKLLLQNI
jgi:hypothetical protein